MPLPSLKAPGYFSGGLRHAWVGSMRRNLMPVREQQVPPGGTSRITPVSNGAMER